MAFQVQAEQRDTTSGLDGTVYRLEDSGRRIRAEIWPAFGFNCYHWSHGQDAEGDLQLLYTDPQLFHNSSPTRSGIPVLFPFPNRIRDGHFIWDGRAYELPCNDSTKKNAIHGFACRRPWRVIAKGSDADSAWLTGEFHTSRDAAEVRHLWPADQLLRLTYRLSGDALRLEAEVYNPDRVPLPFGLGYHPYFHVPFATATPADQFLVQAAAREMWELRESLPTGRRLPLDLARDLRRPRPFNALTLDDVLTGLPEEPDADGLILHGQLRDAAAGHDLQVLASPSFRELVVFTPPHRHAVCLEPYTCLTDAVNLQQSGVDAGWLVLPPGGSWRVVVELRLI